VIADAVWQGGVDESPFTKPSIALLVTTDAAPETALGARAEGPT
jgi:hypothetical protein